MSALEACIAFVEHEHDGDAEVPRDVQDARQELARLLRIEAAAKAYAAWAPPDGHVVAADYDRLRWALLS